MKHVALSTTSPRNTEKLWTKRLIRKHDPGPEGAVRFASIARREVTVNDPFSVGESGNRIVTQPGGPDEARVIPGRRDRRW